MSLNKSFIRGFTDPERQKEIQSMLSAEPLEKDRTFISFSEPSGRRVSEYEAIMLHAQNSNDTIAGSQEVGPTVMKWTGGRPNYSIESTEMKSSNWYAFRDPEKRWFFPYVKNKTEEGRFTDRFFKAYSASGEIRLMDEQWRHEVLDRVYGAYLYNEYGLFNAHSSIVNTALSDLIRTFVAQIGFDKNDSAQMIQMQRVFLGKLDEDFNPDLVRAKDMWMNDPMWQGARTTVQELWQETMDWLEGVWACHSVYDAIFGQYVRREVFQRVAPAFRDTLTPWITVQASTYHQNALQGSNALFNKMLLEDPVYGAHNKRWLHVWTEKWLQKSVDALGSFIMGYQMHAPRQIEGITDKESVRLSVQRVFEDWKTFVADPIDFEVDVDALVNEVMARY
ncbi:MAG: methane monooxygenase [Methylococcaceae bacterium]